MIKCQGCGAILQNADPNNEGYVNDLSKNLCERCFRIRHYNEYKFSDKTNDYYLDIINKISKTNDLILLVTDFLNIDSLREININNPIILVLTKRDLIPRSLDENKLINKINSNLNIVSKVVVGSKNNYNLDLLLEKINKYKTSNNVYVIGYTNAGKSTLINKLIKNYSDNQTEITTSVLPSTTLDLIEVKINDNLTIIDTPGLLDEGNIVLSNNIILDKILPKKEIKPIVLQIKSEQIVIVEDIIRLDVSKDTSLIFYMSNSLNIERYYKDTNKLKELTSYDLELKGNHDLVIKGLGFIKTTHDCNIKLYLNDDVKYNVRQSII